MKSTDNKQSKILSSVTLMFNDAKGDDYSQRCSLLEDLKEEFSYAGKIESFLQPLCAVLSFPTAGTSVDYSAALNVFADYEGAFKTCGGDEIRVSSLVLDRLNFS